MFRGDGVREAERFIGSIRIYREDSSARSKLASGVVEMPLRAGHPKTWYHQGCTKIHSVDPDAAVAAVRDLTVVSIR